MGICNTKKKENILKESKIEFNTNDNNVILRNQYYINIKVDPSFKIIIMDDISINRELLWDTLILNNISENQIVSLGSGKECIDYITQHNFRSDIILADINMPELDGYQTTQILREKGFQGLIIGITGMASWLEYEKAYQAGLNFIHFKPIRVKQLVDLINQYIPTSVE